jgi:Mg-chelatase subunit ChlD
MKKGAFRRVLGGFLVLVLLTGCSGGGDKEGDNSQSSTKPKKERAEVLAENGSSLRDSECERQYQELLASKKGDFSKCRVDFTEAECKKDSVSSKQKNLVVILDVSGSMAANIGGISRLEAAKRALSDYLEKAQEDLNISLVVYGHKGGNQASQKIESCRGIEAVVAMESVGNNASLIQEEVGPLSPTGWTPISESLKKAESILDNYSGEGDINSILLLSDGKESCGGSPVKEAERISKRSGSKIFIDVVGLDVSGDDQAQLKEIAESAGGRYFEASVEEDLRRIFEEHENEMENFECKMAQFDENLNQSLLSLNTYNDCIHSLDMEKFEIELAVELNEGVSASCGEYVLENYNERFEEIKGRLDKNREEEKKEAEEKDPLNSNSEGSEGTELENLDELTGVDY